MSGTWRELAIEQLLGHVADSDHATRDALSRSLAALLARFDDAAGARFFERVATTGSTWGYHPPDPVARALDHLLAERVVAAESRLVGSEHLAAARGRSVTFFANHLSFADAHVVDYLLHRDGYDEVASRLAVVAGPKVYTDVTRRLSSLCFGSIKTPQSAERATDEAVMSRREIARLALETLDAVALRRRTGDHPLVFVEGARSRTGAMQPALAAVSRYLDDPAVVFIPVGIDGSASLSPVGDAHVHTTRVDVTLGPPVAAARATALTGGKRKLLMDVVGLCIARLLPAEARGVYGDDAAALDGARAIVRELHGG